MATSSQQLQLQQETFSEADLNASGLVTAAAEMEEVTDKDAAQDDEAKGGHMSRKVK